MIRLLRIVSGQVALGLAFVAAARAQFTIPAVSYTATPGETGLYTYFDDTGHQLTDGVFGAPGWNENLGNGNAYEWVAWNATNPTLVFTFAGNATITKVEIGFNRSTAVGIVLPPTVVIGGTSFFLDGSEVAENSRGTLAFTGNWTGTTLTINLIDNNVNYIFVDEVSFTGTAIPEASSSAAALALTALVGTMVARRNSGKLRLAKVSAWLS